MECPDRVQLHLALSFKKEPRDHPRIAALLEEGYRIDQLQRVTDQEALVTLVRPEVADPQPNEDRGDPDGAKA